MGAELLSSKVVVQEETPRIRSIEGVPTSVGLMVGITEKGPIGVATLVTSDAEFQRIFGGDIADGVARQCVRGFYQNGGRDLWFVRTVHYTTISNPASKTSVQGSLTLNTAATAPSSGKVTGSAVGPFALVSGDDLDVDIDAGGPATATFTAAAAARTAGPAAPYALANGQTLTVNVNGTGVQTVTFLTGEFVDITNATAAEVAAVLAAKLSGVTIDLNGGKPRITTDRKGTSASLDVTGGTANAALGFTTGVLNGTGNVANIDAVSVAEIKTIVELAVAGCTVTDVGGKVRITSNATGTGSKVQVMASSTADDELGLDNALHSGLSGVAVPTLQVDGKYDGTYANDITILIQPATNTLRADWFNLVVLDDGVVVERWPNLSMDDAATNFAETLINDATNGSNWIEVTDLDANPANPDAERPADSPGTPPVAFGPLTGGNDGLAGIVDNDYIGDESAKNGIRAFDLVDNGTLLFIPDRPTFAVQAAMITYAEITRSMSIFCVLDPPVGYDREAIVTYVETTAGLENLSEFGAFYWPQVKVLNPDKTVFGNDDNIIVPPSGHIAGMYRRTDASRTGGIYEPPAGVEKGVLAGITGLETDSVNEEATRDFVAPHRINPICKLPGWPIAVDDSMTLKGGGNFPSVSERRGVIYIEQSVKNGIQFARQRNNDAGLRDEVARTITAFLVGEMRKGAFRTKNPATAFFVDVSAAINPPSEVFAGRLNARVGLCTQKPARFVILTFSQDTRALEEELARR